MSQFVVYRIHMSVLLLCVICFLLNWKRRKINQFFFKINFMKFNSIDLNLLTQYSFFFSSLALFRSLLKHRCWNNVPFWARWSVCVGWWWRGTQSSSPMIFLFYFCFFSLCFFFFCDWNEPIYESINLSWNTPGYVEVIWVLILSVLVQVV